MPKVDIEKFLSDPAHERDRDFLDAYITNFLERKAEESKEKKTKESASIFDTLFGSHDE